MGRKIQYFKSDSSAFVLPNQITSEQIVQIYIDRIKEIQPLVNCVVKTLYTEAIDVIYVKNQHLKWKQLFDVMRSYDHTFTHQTISGLGFNQIQKPELFGFHTQNAAKALQITCLEIIFSAFSLK